MKYRNGSIVTLQNGKTVFIVGYDDKTKEYSGVNVDVNNPQEHLQFSVNDVLVEILK